MLYTRSILNIILMGLVMLTLWDHPNVLAEEVNRFLPLSASDHNYYLDIQALTPVEPSPENTPVYHVWIKTEYLPQKLDQLIHDRHTGCLPTAGYDCLSYSLEHYLFNPTNMEIQRVETYHYGQSDTLLDHIITPLFALKWQAVSSDSEQDLLFNQVSDYIAQAPKN